MRLVAYPVTMIALGLAPLAGSAIASPTEAEPPEPTTGELVATDRKTGARVPFTLTHTRVEAHIAGNLSRVAVTQVFANPLDTPLEAVYSLALPDEAAVDQMDIKLGNRVIVGKIKKRNEAKAIYDAAKAAGQTAALLDQERDNLFTQKVANIKPGETVEVTVAYSDALRFEGQDYAFFFPMAVGPRYIPGKPNGRDGTNLVPDAQAVVPPALRPGERSGRDVDVTLTIEAGVPVGSVTSPSHDVVVGGDATKRIVTLAAHDRIPNKGLHVRYSLAGSQTATTVLTQQDPRGGHFAAYMLPAVTYREDEVVPKDVVFLMDTSGSQDGDPIVQSKALMHRMIDGLNGEDTFAIIDFADRAIRLAPAPLPNTAANRRKAHTYIDKLKAEGGTELMHGIDTVLGFPAASGSRLRSVVLVTDGLIGDDEQVVAAVAKRLPPRNRLYAFGVGPEVNRYVLERLAEEGRGTCTVVAPAEPLRKVTERFYRQINDPVLTDIQISWQGSGPAPELFPDRPRDLFAHQPIVVYGRKGDAAQGTLHITGTLAGGKPYTQDVSVAFTADVGNPAIAQLWGRQKLKAIARAATAKGNDTGFKEYATRTALDYRLMSPYTSFVAVTEKRVDPAAGSTTVKVPQEPLQGLTSRAYGDPHILTGDGLKYDAGLTGDFVAFRSKSGDLAVHTRIAGLDGDPSKTYNVALAARLSAGGPVVTYHHATKTLAVDGKRIFVWQGRTVELPGGLKIIGLARGWALVGPKGDRVLLSPVVDHVDFQVVPAASRPDADVAGLLGAIDVDRDPANDARDRAGEVVAPPTGPASQDAFQAGWRVRADEVLPGF